MKDLCQKWKVKLILFEAPETAMARSDWPRPPNFTTDLHRWAYAFSAFRVFSL